MVEGLKGLKATPPPWKFQKEAPLKILPLQLAKILKAVLPKFLEKLQNFWWKKQKFSDFSQNFELFFNIFDQILKLILVTPVIIKNLWKFFWNVYDPPP